MRVLKAALQKVCGLHDGFAKNQFSQWFTLACTGFHAFEVWMQGFGIAQIADGVGRNNLEIMRQREKFGCF